MSKNLYLIRGLPGSGKSTLAKKLSYQICEADSFFMVKKDSNGKVLERNYYGIDGEYDFDPSLLKVAHENCRTCCENFMEDEYSNVVVSNTFTQEWEMEDYYKLADKYGYRVFSLIVENRHGGESTHDVPDKSMNKMRNRFEVEL